MEENMSFCEKTCVSIVSWCLLENCAVLAPICTVSVLVDFLQALKLWFAGDYNNCETFQPLKQETEHADQRSKATAHTCQNEIRKKIDHDPCRNNTIYYDLLFIMYYSEVCRYVKGGIPYPGSQKSMAGIAGGDVVEVWGPEGWFGNKHH